MGKHTGKIHTDRHRGINWDKQEDVDTKHCS